jgi:hypothetical protein
VRAGLRAPQWLGVSVRRKYERKNSARTRQAARYRPFNSHESIDAVQGNKVATIFEDSPISLDKWLIAVWMIVNCNNGISSYETARDLGVTPKSA